MRPFELFLYVAVVFGWSTSWYPLSLQLGVVAPEVSIFWRFLVSSLMMLAITALCGIRLSFEPGEHLRFMFLGMALFSTNFALFYNSSLYLASGLLAVILSMSSLINVVLVAAINRRPPPLLQMVAAIVGLVGLGLIFAPEFKTLPTAGIAVAYGVLATFSFCIGNLLSSRSQQRGVPVLASTSWGMVYGTLFMGIIALLRGHPFIIDMSPSYLFSLAWLILVSSVMTFACYLSLVGRIGPGRAAYATVVFPIFALLISARYEGYEWSVAALAGLALVIIGNLIMIRARD
jgi:drug/metabolite transporter (DMT)-like permease